MPHAERHRAPTLLLVSCALALLTFPGAPDPAGAETPPNATTTACDTSEPSCKKSKRKTRGPGSILVGNPEIVTRERLVNDRLRQERWLEEQLEESDDAKFGFQGLADMRSFLGLSARVGVEADANLLDLYDTQSAANLADIKRQQEQNDLQNRINTLEKLKMIRDLENELEGTGNGVTAASTDTDTGGETPATDDGTQTPVTDDPSSPPTNPSTVGNDIKLDFQTRLLTQGRDKLAPSSASPEQTNATASPIDTFRDHLAYREEIRNEIFENALDDRHDLRGNTAYRLNIDTTILPKRKQDAWAVVEVEVTEKKLDAAGWRKLLNRWKIDLEREINSLLLTRLQSAIPCYGLEENETAKSTIRVGCLPEDLEREIYSHFQREILRSILDNTLTGRDNTILETVYDTSGDGATVEEQRKQEEEQRKQKIDSYLHTLETWAERSRCSEVACSDVEREREFLGVNLNIAIDTIKGMFKDCTTRLGALAYLMASFHDDLFSDVEGLDRFVYIEKIDPGDHPHLYVRFQEDLSDEEKCRLGIEDCRKHRKEIQAHLESAKRVYAFAATPKETVQRISEVAARRNSIELAALLNSRKAKGAAEAVLESQRLLHGIARRPLVVGYTLAQNRDTGGASMQATAGWVLGPKFKINDAVWTAPWNKGFRYEHTPIQNNLSFTMSVPEWWTSATLTIRRHWRTTKGKMITSEPAISHEIELPGTLEGITRALVQYRLPQVIRQEHWDVVHGKPASLLIRGAELWRSSEVTLGGQVADEIQVLPNMRGIVATFTKVSEPASVDGKKARANVPVRVWTSEGSQQAGTVSIHPGKPEAPKALKIKVNPPLLVKGGDLVLEITQGGIPAQRTGLAVQLYAWNGGSFDPPVYFDGTRVHYDVAKKTVSLTLDPALVATIQDQREVRVQLVVNEKRRGTPTSTNADNLVPFYTAEPKIAFSVKKAGADSKDLDGEIELTTKMHLETAYPGFGKDSKVVFTAGPHTLRLNVETWTKKADGTFVLRGTFKDLNGIASGTELEVTPKLEDAGLAGKIGFHPASIKLKKP